MGGHRWMIVATPFVVVSAVACRGGGPEIAQQATSVTTTVAGTSAATNASGPGIIVDPSITDDPYGTATMEPDPVARGGEITITPTGEVAVQCLSYAVVHSVAGSGPVPLGQLGTEGHWTAFDGTTPTVPGCGPPPSADAVRYQLPPEIGPGAYVLCLTAQPTEAACGTFRIE
ncbi:hypothetical protein BH18ACT2_BH18ACT2_23190 [soil metagenome]